MQVGGMGRVWRGGSEGGNEGWGWSDKLVCLSLKHLAERTLDTQAPSASLLVFNVPLGDNKQDTRLVIVLFLVNIDTRTYQNMYTGIYTSVYI